jgi:hypothetical protein
MSTATSSELAAIKALIDATPNGAMFIGELVAASVLPLPRVEEMLTTFADRHEVTVVWNASPDRHLDGDWRVVASRAGRDAAAAAAAAAQHYDQCVRTFLQRHRCT